MNEIKIRKATMKDLKEIIRIFITEYSKKPYNENWKYDVVKNKIQKYLKYERKLYVATTTNKITAFIIFSKNIWDDGNHLVIDELIVDSEQQGKGIGKTLLNFAKDYFKDVVSIDFWTFKNSKAYSIYKKWGYKNHETGVMMTKKLK